MTTVSHETSVTGPVLLVFLRPLCGKMLKAKILSYGKPYFWSTLSHERLVTAFVLSRRLPSFSRRAALVPSFIFDKTYLFYRIKYSPGLYFSCSVLMFTKHICFIVWRAHFFSGLEKCSKHMCVTVQDGQLLIFLLRGTCFQKPPEMMFPSVRGAR